MLRRYKKKSDRPNISPTFFFHGTVSVPDVYCLTGKCHHIFVFFIVLLFQFQFCLCLFNSFLYLQESVF